MEAEVKSGTGVVNVNYKIPANWKEDKYSWIYLGVMVLTLIAGAIMKVNLGIFAVIPYIVVMRMEKKLASKDGINMPSEWWALLVPVYLWQRLTILKQPRIHFWLWIGVTVGLCVILGALSPE